MSELTEKLKDECNVVHDRLEKAAAGNDESEFQAALAARNEWSDRLDTAFRETAAKIHSKQ